MSDGSPAKPRGTRDVRVDRTTHPNLITALDRLPKAGERVQTHEGSATVKAILGKTSDGSRLLELAMDDGRKHAFFASSANVLVDREPAAD